MTVSGYLAVDGTAKVEALDDRRRTKINKLRDLGFDLGFRYVSSAKGINKNRYRLCYTDSVCNLNLALVGKSGFYNILGNVTGRITSGTVNLCGVFTRESTATVTCISAIGINNDLTTGKTRITRRTADYKTTGGVNVDLGCIIHHTLGNDGKNYLTLDILANLLCAHLITVLRGNNNGINTNRLAVLIIFNGNLSLTVGTQIFECAVFANLGQTKRKLVRQRDRQGHQLGGLVASVTKHQALVARAEVKLVGIAVFCFKGFVNTHCNIGRLRVQGDDNGTAIAVKTVFCTVVTDLANGFADDSLNVHIRTGGDLTHYTHKTRGAECFAGYAGHRVLAQHFVKDGIRDLVADLVGMPLGNRFTCK